jgi:hypothetical protein
MTDELETRLKAALAPVDPPAGFAERLLAKLPAEPPAAARSVAAPPRARRQWLLPASLAASLVLTLAVHQHLSARREAAAGLAARAQLLEALRVTSQKLDIAYEAVQSPDAQAEENRT